jgi:threonine/homoserine/homoserine lactone efflux protein
MLPFIEPFVSGFAVGLSIAVPVGPMSIWCIQRTLMDGLCTGFIIGFGAATAHLIYGSLAFLSMSTLAQAGLFAPYHGLLNIVLGSLLIGFAVRILRRRIIMGGEKRISFSGVAAAYVGTLAIGLSNPLTALYFMVTAPIFTASVPPDDISLMLLGITSGSASWWVTLVTGVTLMRRRVTCNGLRLINVASGLTLGIFGAFVAGRGLSLLFS